MRSLTYSMGVSLDGYIAGPDGTFGWTAPDEEVFRLVTDETREVGVHLLGRRLYETMLYWETADQDPSLNDSMVEWAAIWKPLPKVVFSTTLCGAGQRPPGLQRPGGGDRAVASRAGRGRHRDRRRDSRRRGGRIGSDRRVPGQGLPGAGWRWHSVLSQRERRVDLELVETRTFSSKAELHPVLRAVPYGQRISFVRSRCEAGTRTSSRAARP